MLGESLLNNFVMENVFYDVISMWKLRKESKYNAQLTRIRAQFLMPHRNGDGGLYNNIFF